jgi:hypothetical protein
MSYSINPTLTVHDAPSDWAAINTAEYHLWCAARDLRAYPWIGTRSARQDEGKRHLRRARALLELVRDRRLRIARRCY